MWGGPGLAGWTQGIARMGLRPVPFWAYVSAFAEFAGGLAFALGFLLPVVAATRHEQAAEIEQRPIGLQPLVTQRSIRLGKAADLVRYPLAQVFSKFLMVPVALLQRDKARNRLSRDLVRLANYRRFGYRGMSHQRRFQLHGAEPVATDVHHVIHAAQNTEVAIAIAARGVTCEIVAGNSLPVLFFVALRVVPDGP